MKISKTVILAFGSWLLILSSFAQSPYIYKVYEYMPAPGQFVNKLPLYEKGDTHNDMRLKAEESIAGQEEVLVSLGGYGGYIIFGFDHMIENVSGEYDFKILGNAFYANANPNPDAPAEGGSCEPGIVMVSYDANGNGKPDDEWYELAGSEYYKPETIKNYRITYYKPDENKEPAPDEGYPYLNDTTYIRWESNQGDYGYISRNIFHDQSYYPLWIEEEELVFEGTKLAGNYVEESGQGTYYVLYAYDWGYVDNHPNRDERSNFKIDWAVDSNGEPVQLPGVHFIKVYTGVNQYCGWLGETSTEIAGAYDLHLINGTTVAEITQKSILNILNNPVREELIIAFRNDGEITIYDIFGKEVKRSELQSGTNRIPCFDLSEGIYIIKGENQSFKFIKKAPESW